MAISLSKTQLAHKVYSMAVIDADSLNVPLIIPDVEEMIDTAVDRLCDQIINTPKYFYLHTTQNVSVVSGVGSLTATTYLQTVLPSNGGSVTLGGLSYACYVPSIRDLTIPKAGSDGSGTAIGYWTVRGTGGTGRLHVYTASGTAWSGTATVIACEKQTFTGLNAQLEEELIAVLYDMVLAKIQGRQYQEG